MEIFDTVLIAAAFLCSLAAGFLFAFAVVVMPGIKSRLADAHFSTDLGDRGSGLGLLQGKHDLGFAVF